MDPQQILNCSFSAWYPKFKKITWRSVIIPLAKDFLNYLQADGLFLPPDDGNSKISVQQDETHEREHEHEPYDDDDGWDVSESVEVPQFPDLNEQIKCAIKKLGGAAFPKLNWSSAKDATWISFNNTMKCVTPNDVYLLLKSSDFMSHDLTEPFKHCDVDADFTTHVKYELVLREWINVNPSMEFRCFVKNNILFGICQRDITNYYSYIGQQQEKIIEDITLFFQKKIRGRFSDSSYVFDVYRQDDENVILMDFNPFGKTTDDLLFDWHSVLETTVNESNGKPEFRFISNAVGVQPSPYRIYAMPKDVIDIETGVDAHKLIDLLRLQTEQTTK